MHSNEQYMLSGIESARHSSLAHWSVAILLTGAKTAAPYLKVCVESTLTGTPQSHQTISSSCLMDSSLVSMFSSSSLSSG